MEETSIQQTYQQWTLNDILDRFKDKNEVLFQNKG